ncbi:MAG: GTPase HflX [Deltaproteobacteria bacterium]|nr:GTPase HflX [Deltaproteobacteria bacterium]
MRKVYGNTNGLRASQIKALERVYRRRVPPHLIITPELARYLTELSLEIRRQIGIIINRKGEIVFTIVGDDKEILIPDLSRYRGGRGRLRGLMCIHTHLKGEDLSQDDLTDLALLRLDLMAALEVNPQGLPGKVFLGYLLPGNEQEGVWRVEEYRGLADLNLNLLDFIHSLEDELQKGFGVLQVDGKERAILVSVVPHGRPYPIEDSLEELKELTLSTDLEVIDVVVQRPKKIHPKYLMGEGKLKDLIIKGLQSGADIIVFNHNLSPAQVNAIAEVTDLKVIDRTQLILDIFAKRAHSRDGKVRVELAQLKYLLPRLTGKGTAMSRLMGGIGGRGPGETKLEIDRRRIKDRIHHLEKQLEHLGKGRWQRRTKRLKQGLPIVSIVGYTNAGKSTLLNALTNSEVEVQDKLFATLDTSSRRLRFPKEREVIITDTVGFIRNLPLDLLGAFHSTLDELHDADLLLHVIDMGNPRFEDQMVSVEELLKELDLWHIPLLRVFNKEDTVGSEFAEKVCQRFGGVSICALDRETFFALLQKIEDILWGKKEGVKGVFNGGNDKGDHRELAGPLLLR